MPYNTRRKSLSLPSLGIQLPQSSRAYVARDRATPASASTSASASATATPATPRGDAHAHHAPPSKRVKRSHSLTTPPPLPGATAAGASITNPSGNRSSTTTIKSPTTNSSNRSTTAAAATKNPRRRHAMDHTPPPSPRPSCEPRIDLDGIGDEVVIGVIQQLERTGNKPQLVKELAAVLCNTLDVVER